MSAHGHSENFITKYIFSQDHKMIARQYLITGIIMGFVGGFLSIFFRLQLGWDGMDLGFLKGLFGNYLTDTGDAYILSPDKYLALVTMHGTIIVFFVLTAGLSGTFSNLLIPLQIGARDMASPFLNMLSYWFFFVSSAIMLFSLFIESGPASAGWTIYPPLSALPKAIPGSGLGMTLWLVSMALFIASSLMGALNYISTILNMRTKGLSFKKLPLTIWSFFLTAILGTLSFPVLLSAALLLIFDRSFGTSFYLSDIFIGGEALTAQTGGSPILFQHLFWFLGHPEVYIILMPALGITSEVIGANARKPIFGYHAMVISLLGISVLSFIVWGHHMFVTGMNPFLGGVFMIVTLIIAIPSAVKTFNYLATLWKGNIRFTNGMMFSIGLVSLFISGGLTGIFLGNAAIDIPLHNTYFVVAHFHIVMGASAIFGMFSGVYHWYPKMFGRVMNKKLGYLHFWLTFVSVYCVFFPQHFQGLAGVPRRYYAFTEFEFAEVFIDLNKFMTVAAIVGFGAQFIFLYNFFVSIFNGEKAGRNPWKANTLEWSVANPGHGNWEGAVPEVFRGPHEFSKPDDRLKYDYLPQWISEEDIERGVDYDAEDHDPIKKEAPSAQNQSTEAEIVTEGE